VEQGERDATRSMKTMMAEGEGYAWLGDENVSELGRRKGGRISNRSEVRALISRVAKPAVRRQALGESSFCSSFLFSKAESNILEPTVYT